MSARPAQARLKRSFYQTFGYLLFSTRKTHVARKAHTPYLDDRLIFRTLPLREGLRNHNCIERLKPYILRKIVTLDHLLVIEGDPGGVSIRRHSQHVNASQFGIIKGPASL